MSASKRYEVDTWFERDRAMVRVLEYYKPAPGAAVTEYEVACWWDEDVSQLVEDGFLDPRDWTGSAVDYAMSLGLASC